MAWRVIKTSGRGGRNSSIDYVLRIANHTGKLAVTVPEKTMRRLKWKRGDRVEFLIDDESRLLGIRRTTDSNAFTLSHPGGKTNSTKHAACKCTLPDGYLSKCVNGSPRVFMSHEVVIDDDQDMIAVELLPKGNLEL